MDIAKYIDHTFLKRDALRSEMDTKVKEAVENHFASLCINPTWINYVKNELHKNNVKVCVVIGFPFGQFTTETKVFEAKDAIKRGADELDFIANITKIHERDEKYIEHEFKEIRKATKGKVIKLIIETGLLNDDEKRWVTKKVVEAKFDFVKTSTGVDTTGATVHDVKLMKEITGDKIQIKASGGVRTLEQAQELIAAGATRIGTSNGVDIIKGKKGQHNY